jgi:phospholipase/carboxylesterase
MFQHMRGWITVVLLLAACRTTSKGEAKADGDGGLEVAVVGGPASGPSPRVVVLLHGWGAPGDDLVPIARMLARPDTRFVVPAAPLPHPAGGRAWWPLDLERRQRAFAEGQPTTIATEVPEGLAAARARVQALLRQVRERHQPQLLVLAGYSQGGMLAMDVALAADPPVDRVAVLSGTVIAETLWRARMASPHKPAAFLCHGRQDPVLPFAGSERLKRLLEDNGFSVTWLPFDGGHQIPGAVVDALGAFIAR